MAEVSTTSTRVSALDNLRVFAMLLGLAAHGALPYLASGVTRFPIRDHSSHLAADVCFYAVHDFRMQLFFLLAGFAAAALADRRGAAGLVRNRLLRVAAPLLLAAAVVCPVMHLLFALHCAERGFDWVPENCGGWVGPNFHLWFLWYLLLCCAVLLAVRSLAAKLPAGLVRTADAAQRRLLGGWVGVGVLAAVGVAALWDMEGWLVDAPSGWEPDGSILGYYLLFFLSGAALHRHRDLLTGFGGRWQAQLAVAHLLVLPVMLKLTVTGHHAEYELAGAALPGWLVAWKAAALLLGGLYTWLTVRGLVGLFLRHCAGRGRVWEYLSDASYWCYLAGFPVQAALQVWLAPRHLPILAEFAVVMVLTFAVLLVSYELFVRYSWLGWLLSGKRASRVKPTPIVIATRLELPQPRCGTRRLPDPVAAVSFSSHRPLTSGSSSAV